MAKPIIAVVVGRNNLEAKPREIQSVWTGCSVNYIESVLKSGGAPVLVPVLADRDSVSSILEAAGGLLLTGGGDVVSLLYGEEPHGMSMYQDPARDELEIEAVRGAMELGLPILGICRGIQILNVALGGTLVQDIPSQVPDSIKHASNGLTPLLQHTVDVTEDSLLSRVLQTTSLATNSSHHQSVKDLGRGLKVNALARDGVVEGIESSEGNPILAVQWHPEEIASDYPVFQLLFDWLVNESA